MTKAGTGLAIAFLLLLVVACSDTGDPDEPSEARSIDLVNVPPEGDGSPNLVDLEYAVQYFLATFAQDDPDRAVGMLSNRCAPLVGHDVRAAVADVPPDADLDLTSFEGTIDGFTATVTYEVGAPGFSRDDERWIAEGGSWRLDDCPSG